MSFDRLARKMDVQTATVTAWIEGRQLHRTSAAHHIENYRWGRDGARQKTMDYLEFIARVTSHIPDKGQVMVRYFSLC